LSPQPRENFAHRAIKKAKFNIDKFLHRKGRVLDLVGVKVFLNAAEAPLLNV